MKAKVVFSVLIVVTALESIHCAYSIEEIDNPSNELKEALDALEKHPDVRLFSALTKIAERQSE